MITFNWTIPSVERKTSLDGLSDVIKTVHWRYRGTDKDGVTAETYGSLSLEDPNPEDFTPWDEVTSTDVIGWLESIMSKKLPVEEGEDPKPTQLEQIQANIISQIDLIKKPQTITGPLANS